MSESDNLAGLTWTIPEEDALDDGEYFWRVKAIDAVGNESAWSDSRRLLISFQKLPKYGTITTDTTPTFEWLAVTNAENYQLVISHDLLKDPGDFIFGSLAGLTSFMLPVENELVVGNH